MASTKWKTQFDRKREFFTSPGSAIVKHYSSRIDKEGNIEVYEDGEKDLYAYIQSFADACDINNIIAKYAATGDDRLLNVKPGAYMDLTDMPDNIIDIMNGIKHGQELFADLDPAIREKFGNDVNRFLATIGSDEWFSNLGLQQEKESPVEVAEVNESEVE